MYVMNFIAISGSNDEKLVSLDNIGITDEIFITGLSELKNVINCMRLLGMPENSFMIDLTI